MISKLSTEKCSELKIIHLTDTHLLDSPDDMLYGFNTRKNLQTVLSHALQLYPDIDILLFTGDISQTGSEASYQIFKSIIDYCEIPVLCLPGNHDNPGHLKSIIHTSPNESPVFIKQDKFSVILLNSWVDGAHHGRLDEFCLTRLQQYLQTSSSTFNIFALHHTPVNINSKWLDELGLKNQARLLEIIHQSAQPSLLLSGHIHQQLDIQMKHLRLLATPSTCHQFKTQTDEIQCLDHSLASFRYIKISLPDQIATSVHFIDCCTQD
jgi:3',5'-cyclic-AMP phosphodiesterase